MMGTKTTTLPTVGRLYELTSPEGKTYIVNVLIVRTLDDGYAVTGAVKLPRRDRGMIVQARVPNN